MAELSAGHDAAAAAAFRYLEQEACRARRGAGGHIEVRGIGFLGAAFRHRASRAGDPLLHTHVVVGNLTKGPDGRWTALDARYLYRHAKTAGYLYQAELRRELTRRLGLEWGPVEHGVADVRGVPRSVMEHFSRRRTQILEHMAEHGGRSARSAQVAALETRRAKDEPPADRLREQWRSRAAEHGFDAMAVERLLDCSRGIVQPLRGAEIAQLTESASTFGRAELLQVLAAAQQTGATVGELERLADAVLAHREIVPLGAGRATAAVNEKRFTTLSMLRIERELIERAERRRHAHVGVAGSDAVGGALERRGLTDEQRDVVRSLGRRGDGVLVLRAAAGTGKTFVLDAAREAWEASCIDVVGCALSARAVLELADQSGVRSLTIASLLQRLDNGESLPAGGVLVVDEAGMVGTRALASLARAVDAARGKLVLVGDDRQLPEIDAGGAFHSLAERLGALELREVRRQRHAWDRDALDALRSGDVERWARAYRERGQITVSDRAAEVRAALVNDWFRAGGDRLMIAGRREDVRDLNDRARQLLRDEGALRSDELEVGGRAFAVGDRVVGRRNDRAIGILNGQRGTVRQIDRDQGSVSVDLDGGAVATVPHGYLDAGHLDHGYAITAHRAQGATVDRVFVLGSDELYREWGYTALSRHREEARFYITRGELDGGRDQAPEPDPIVAGVARLMGRSRAKELAIDGLTDATRDDLLRAREVLTEAVLREPTPAGDSDQLARERDRAAAALQAARDGEAALREQRSRLRWFDRRARDQLDHGIGIAGERVRSLTESWQRASAAHERAVGTERRWIGRHGEEGSRLVAVDRELRLRDGVDRAVARRLERLVDDRDPLTPTREVGRDLGIGR